MSHVPGHPEHGCPKCVINLLFMAALARYLAGQVEDKEIRQEATRLADEAQLANRVYAEADRIGLIEIDASKWTGCRESATLTRWIIQASEPKPHMIATMFQWRMDIMSDLLAFLSIKPYEGE